MPVGVDDIHQFGRIVLVGTFIDCTS